MPLDNRLSRTAYVYIGLVIAAGVAAVGHSAYSLSVRPISHQWLLLAALTLLTGSFSVRVPSVAARHSVSETFVFAAVLLYGPAAATAIVALDSFIMSMWLERDGHFRLRSMFNVATATIAVWLAATAFFWLAQVEPGDIDRLRPLATRLWQLFALASVYFLLNSALVALAVSFERKANAAELWWENFPLLSLNYFGAVSVAALLVSYTRSVDISAIAIILPLLLFSYLTFSTSLKRVEESKRHVEQVSALYMSAIETLAMAVDAKDQITHGHIRRVQVYTVELAKRLGVSDKHQLEAIAAAALLHDMGKLAIPEYILNKPGKLTAAEFEKMKRHADIGADLLSSIKFPYPVVPIVRHHHEFWDGGGYPSGIAGTDIPLGARILSVVDCFDALTSDRPYRPRLTDSEAFKILYERRGTMYDPLVVDTFASAHAEISPAAIKAGHEARSIANMQALREIEDDSGLRDIRASASESALLSEFDRQVKAGASKGDAFELAFQLLRQVTPTTVCAFFRCSAHMDALSCDLVAGDPQRLLEGLIIPLGQRVTGWSGANGRTSVNAHAALDLAQIADRFAPSLQSTICSPITGGGQLIGVLTGYSTEADAFTDDHRYAFERVATLLAGPLTALTTQRRVVSFPQKKIYSS